jgi:hypothetical protein
MRSVDRLQLTRRVRCAICSSAVEGAPSGDSHYNSALFDHWGNAVAVSLFDVSIPVLIRGLSNLSAIIDKAAAYAEAKKLDPTTLPQARLFPDMFPLTRQVQITCDTAKGAAARLAGIEIPKHEDNETTLSELKQRIAKTLDFIKGIRASQLEGAEGRSIEMKGQNRTLNFTGTSYLTQFVLPNFYFHESIAYAILRHNGVEVGKFDYLGAV